MRKFDEMTYTELERHLTEVVGALRTKSYESGYAQGKFDVRAEEAAFNETADKMLADLKRSPQQLRDDIVEYAKLDVEKMLRNSSVGTRAFLQYPAIRGLGHIDFIFEINREKRTVVALGFLKYTGGLRIKGIAKCAPDDCFDVHIGKATALRRALGLPVPAEYLDAPQPETVRKGDIVQWRSHGRTYEIVEAVGNEYKFRDIVDGWQSGMLDYENLTDAAIIIDDSREVDAD